MTLWFVLTVMIAIAAVLVSSPFIRKLERSRLQSTGALAVYRDQLKEVENEAAQGLIDAAQAENASVEIKRRILATAPADDASNATLSWGDRQFAVTAVTAIVVFGSVGLYSIVGNPDMPAAIPQVVSEASMVKEGGIGTSNFKPAIPQSSLIQRAATSSEDPPSRTNPQSQTGLPPVEDMIQRLLTRLQRAPQDSEGWRTLGWSYFSLERFADAASAYSKAIELRPNSAEYRSARGEALVRDADGRVTPEARKELEEALRLDRKDARARFLVGLGKDQAGDKATALADWKSLIAEVDPNEPWLADLRRRITELRRELGDQSPMPPAAAPKSSAGTGLLDSLKAADRSAPPAVERGPGPEDIRNAESMAPQDRNAMIRGMVDGLASRLEQSPRDAEGWIKLMRSRVVLGDADLAKQSFQNALAIFPEEGSDRTRIVEAARSLGLTQ